MMNETELRERRRAVLDETITYYSADPDARRCQKGEGCYYDPAQAGKEATSDGCAIGRLLTPELRRSLPNGGVRDFDIFPKLPDDIRELGPDFLAALQCLHDNKDNWVPGGLTAYGRDTAEGIRSDFNLNDQ
jgi:hypothetical protein